MVDKREQATATGQRQGHADVILNNAAQLARWLGVDGLEKLTDDECKRLVSQINKLTDDAFCEGWDGAMSYNHDMAYLRCAPLTTAH